MKENKPNRDHEFGKDRRKLEAEYINSLFKRDGIDCSVELMDSLYLKVTNNNNGKVIFLWVCYQNSGGVYVPIPKERRHNFKSYLHELQDKDHYIFVVADTPDRRYSHLVSFGYASLAWKPAMGEGENDHKCMFHGEVSKIDFRNPDPQDNEQGLGLELPWLIELINLTQ